MRAITGKKQRLFVLISLSVCAVVIGATGSAPAGQIDRELHNALQRHAPSDHVSVIVHLADKADLSRIRDRDRSVRRSKIIKSLRAKADASQKSVNALLKRRTAKRIRPLWITNGIAASVPAGMVSELAALPGVERITTDAVVRVPVPTVGAAEAPEWNISALNAPELWSLGYTGQGIVVASMDSGVDLDHPDLQSRWRGGSNSWFDPHGQHPLSPYDASGHGTQTMGIMVGADAGGTSIGVAPGARWIAVKIFNDAGDATYSVIHQGFQWLLDPDGNPETDDLPDVVNNSWGLQDPNHECITEFQADVQALKAAGIALSFAAGSDGPASSTGLSPANYPESFSVGAVDNTNTIADFSSRGPSACGGGIFPIVVAPGVNIRTADLYLGVPGAYAVVSGTSFAAPHVAGAMALLLSAFPGQTVSMIETALGSTAKDLGTPGADNDTGYGLIDAAKAHSFLRRSAAGVYRDGVWLLDENRSNGWDSGDRAFVFGIPSDIPVTGDWNGSGTSKVGVYRSGTWFLDMNGNGVWEDGIDAVSYFGIPSDIPVTGDWNGTGTTKIGVVRGTTWFLDANGNGVWEDGVDAISSFGIPGDMPVTGDWNGSGTSKVGVYRSGTWFLDVNGDGTWEDGIDAVSYFGIPSDIPVTGDWNGTGTTKIGVVRGTTWFLDANGNGVWDGGDTAFDFGLSTDKRMAGRW